MSRYVFKPYNKIFSQLFEKEKERLSEYLTGNYKIEHLGSTAVSGLGGKGIIDIFIVAGKKDLKKISRELINAGYEYRSKGSKLVQHDFLRIELPDPLEGIRRYHMHLNHFGAKDFKEAVAFRDYLREHPKETKKYEEAKKKAVKEGNQDRDSYMAAKSPILQEILEKALK